MWLILLNCFLDDLHHVVYKVKRLNNIYSTHDTKYNYQCGTSIEKFIMIQKYILNSFHFGIIFGGGSHFMTFYDKGG